MTQVEPTVGRPPGGRVRRTAERVVVHAGYLLSSFLGDDWVGRRLRVALLRLLSARLAPGVSMHGGTYVSRPRHLTIGPGTFVNRNCYLDLGAPVTLGRNVTVGHGATFVTTGHEIGPGTHRCGDTEALPIVVEDGAWLGANVTVLPGVRVGAGAVVAAGAVVRQDVPPHCVVAGVPARAVRYLDPAPDGDRASDRDRIPDGDRAPEPTTGDDPAATAAHHAAAGSCTRTTQAKGRSAGRTGRPTR